MSETRNITTQEMISVLRYIQACCQVMDSTTYHSFEDLDNLVSESIKQGFYGPETLSVTFHDPR